MTIDDYPIEYWDNWVSDYDQLCPVVRPTTKAELIATVEAAVAAGRQIRAFGSRHSHSRCARPEDLAVDISAISGTFAKVDWLKRNVPGLATNEHLVRVRAGTTLKELARLHLHEMDPPMGLPNAGTFDGQTLAGAISTGTHGTGFAAGSLADLVMSLDIVTVTQNADGSPDVRMRRIEPADGVTDPAAFERDAAAHGMVLEQDDALFHSMVVSYGCMGIVYAYTLRVREEYWLREDTELVEWPDLADQLHHETSVPGGMAPAVADSAPHVWFLLNIAETQGDKRTDAPACFVVRRRETEAVEPPVNWPLTWPPERRSDTFSEVAQDWSGLDPTNSHDSVGGQIRGNYTRTVVGEPAFKGENWSSVSYIVHRREEDDRRPDQEPEVPPPALSIEIAVPATDLVEAMDAAIAAVGRSEMFFISPWGVRFSPPSPHLLSPAYGRPTAWIEVVFVLPTPVFRPQRTLDEVRDTIAKPELERIERELCYSGSLAGRPHLGKHNSVNAGRLADLYPQLQTWLAAYARFNAFGTFDNAFTEQLGLTPRIPDQVEETDRAWLAPMLHAMMS